ncbi:hypothetical protein CTA2_7524 [Colletotrichum tanaceti]|uniref:RRM domain-containing protein n=1 Tax=Colletotrichum tanaceti TaxID=1306861 RepID=A0A4U6X9H2_9PEZI|nr:hypothetical protein CTA2_7524 [Colletotrichum tanaceti]TKW51924.1 hypothetical protein CTA1_2948 [Colletotrichum tanaceti]
MASSFPGGQAPLQGRGLAVGNNDRDAQGANPSALPANSRSQPPSFVYHYPNGIPGGYKMVPARDGETPRRYVEDHLPNTFYNRKDTKAIFSTNNGEVPTRGLNMNHFVSSRELDLWSAEDIQGRANSIRKKHWRSLKSLQEPSCWEDLYDYFDSFDIYFHGALNLWNLMHQLYNENENIVRDNIRSTAVDVGIWADEWVAKTENQIKLRAFHCWNGDIVGLITQTVWDELKKLPAIDMMLIRYALCHRQNQLSSNGLARPSVYPANSLEHNWHSNTLHCWLAGQPVHDTPSGMPPALCPPTIAVGSTGSPSSQPTFAGVGGASSVAQTSTETNTVPKPIVVSGTNIKPRAGPLDRGSAMDISSPGRSRETFTDSPQNTSASVPRNGNPAAVASTSATPAMTPPASLPSRAPVPQIATVAAMGTGVYAPPMGPYGLPFNIPFTTGSNGETQPYYGPVGPSAPLIPPAPERHQQVPRQSVRLTPKKPTGNSFLNDGSSAPAQSSMSSTGGTRVQSAAYQRATLDVNSSFRPNGKRNATAGSSFDQGVRRGPLLGPAHTETGQNAPQEQLQTPTAPREIGSGQSQPQGEPKGWEKIPHTDDSIHGPVFRRSPTKDNRPRSYSRASTKADYNCSNQHPRTAHKYVYTPCACNKCEERERSVYVQLKPVSRAASGMLLNKCHQIMSQWGEVEHVSQLPLADNVTDFACFFVRFKEGSRAREVSAIGDFKSNAVDCLIKTGAMHHTKYGKDMFEASRRDNEQTGSTNQTGPYQPAWKVHSNGFGQTQLPHNRRDSRAQVSLEQYMKPSSQPSPAKVATTHGSSTPLPEKVPQNVAELIGETKTIGSVWTKRASTAVSQASAEAESQSKPPSEDIIPDAEQTNQSSSPRTPMSSSGKGVNKAIVVNLPTTPQKPKANTSTHVSVSDESTTPTNTMVLTPKGSEASVKPVEMVPRTSTDTDCEISPSDGQTKKMQTLNDQAPGEKSTAEKSDPSHSESPHSEKGKYRRVFSQEDDHSVEVFDARVLNIAAKESQSAVDGSSMEEHPVEQANERTRAGHELDSLIDSTRDQEAVATTVAVESSTKKKNKKSKKKKKPASANQGEPSTAQQTANDDTINSAGQQDPEASVQLATEIVEDNEPPTLGEVMAKAKRIVGWPGAKSGSANQTATETPTNVAPQGAAPSVAGAAESPESKTLNNTAKGKQVARTECNEPQQSTEKSDIPETDSKTFRANAGGSLRMPKTRKKQPVLLQLAGSSASEGMVDTSGLDSPRTLDNGLPSATSSALLSSITGQDSRSSEGSPVMIPTPATPLLAEAEEAISKSSPKQSAGGAEATSKSNTLLNPQAKEFVSPPTRATVARPKKVELAPVPLKPFGHRRNVSQTSSGTSRTLTSGNSPVNEEDDQSTGSATESNKGKGKGSAAQRASARDKDAKSSTATNRAPSSAQQTPAMDAADRGNTPSLASDELPASQSTSADDGDWKVQRPKRDISTKQPKGTGQQNQQQQQQQQPQQGQQGSKKNRPLPKKQKIQGQSHLQQQRYVSSPGPGPNPVSVGSKADFPSLPPAPKPESGLPANSIWGKPRSVTTAAATTKATPGDSTTAPKGETSGNPRPKEESGKQ